MLGPKNVNRISTELQHVALVGVTVSRKVAAEFAHYSHTTDL
jgi:hypothetical protein